MTSAVHHCRQIVITDILRSIGSWLRFSEKALTPVMELIRRLAIAEVFFVSGILKMSNWGTAFYLAAHEYHVSWVNPITAVVLPLLVLTITVYRPVNDKVFRVMTPAIKYHTPYGEAGSLVADAGVGQ